MKIKEMPLDSRPREKLLKYGIENLSDAEILAIILRTGVRGENVIEVSNRLIVEYGLDKLASSILPIFAHCYKDFVSLDFIYYLWPVFLLLALIPQVARIGLFGSFILGSRYVKYGLDRFGMNKLVVIGILLASLGAIASVITASLLPERLIYFIISLMFFTFGNAQAFSALQRLAVQSSDTPMGTRMAVFSSLMGGAGVLGSTLASLFYTGTSLSLAYITLASVLCAGFLRLLIKKS